MPDDTDAPAGPPVDDPSGDRPGGDVAVRPARWGWRQRPILWVSVGMLVLVAGLVGTLASGIGNSANRETDSPLIGRPAPVVRGPGIDGGEVDLGRLWGQWVVVNFFATWCVPCQEEHPDLIAFDERHRAVGDAALIGVVYSDSVAAVRAYRADHGGTWPMLDDPDGRIAVSFGVTGVPETYLISPDGIVAAKLVGRVTDAGLEALLQQAAVGAAP